MKIIYRVHALKRMFERGISENEVEQVLTTGDIIEEYPSDTPYPSRLSLGFVTGRPIHVVSAVVTDDNSIVIITVYQPNLNLWEPGFEKRKKR